jgi:hypothetical protein
MNGLNFDRVSQNILIQNNFVNFNLFKSFKEKERKDLDFLKHKFIRKLSIKKIHGSRIIRLKCVSKI